MQYGYFFGSQCGGWPLACFIDIFVGWQIIAVMIFFTYRETSSGGKAKISTWKKFLLFFSLIMFFEGHGLHAAANTINIMISTDVPQKGLINFLDEILSHKLIYTAFFLMLIGGVLVESKKDHETQREVDASVSI